MFKFNIPWYNIRKREKKYQEKVDFSTLFLSRSPIRVQQLYD